MLCGDSKSGLLYGLVALCDFQFFGGVQGPSPVSAKSPLLAHEDRLFRPPERYNNFSPSLWISSMVRGRKFPEPGNNTYRILPDVPPWRASDRIPKTLASATDPSPKVPISA